MAKEDVVIGVVGAILILVVLVGVFVVENREGAREHEVDPVQHEVLLQGGHWSRSASGLQGPQGACVPEVGETECQAARFVLGLDVDGLPEPPEGGDYAAFLSGDGGTRFFGRLQEDQGGHRLHVDEEYDATGPQEIHVVLHAGQDSERGAGLPMFTWGFSPVPEETSFEDTVEARLGGSGWVRTSQTGAVTVSALVDAGLQDVPDVHPWSLDAWLVDESVSPPAYTRLGAYEQEEDGGWVLDVRKERVRVEDQTRFLVSLEAGEGTDAPGWAAYQALLRET